MKRLGCRETSFFFYPFGVTHFAQKGITKKRFACLSKLKRTNRFSFAEKGGFEPPVPLRVRQFSKLLVSATHPPFLNGSFAKKRCKSTAFFWHTQIFVNFFAKKKKLALLLLFSVNKLLTKEKKEGCLTTTQSFHLTLNLIPWKTRCKSTAFTPTDQIFLQKSV